MMISVEDSRARRRSPQAATHLFHVGQMVRMKPRLGAVSANTVELYRVTGTLPPRDNSPQYRIRNDDERHERVASEDSLESAASPTGDATALAERTFGG